MQDLVTLLLEAVCIDCTALLVVLWRGIRRTWASMHARFLRCDLAHSCDGLGAAAQGRKEDLAGEARLLREGAHAAALERAARAQRAAALRAKFAALRSKHAAALDDDGQPRSQASPGACVHACACFTSASGWQEERGGPCHQRWPRRQTSTAGLSGRQ